MIKLFLILFWLFQDLTFYGRDGKYVGRASVNKYGINYYGYDGRYLGRDAFREHGLIQSYGRDGRFLGNTYERGFRQKINSQKPRVYPFTRRTN